MVLIVYTTVLRVVLTVIAIINRASVIEDVYKDILVIRVLYPVLKRAKMLHVHITLGIVCLVRMENMELYVPYPVQRTVMGVKDVK